MLTTTTTANSQYVTLGQACRFLEAHGSVNHMVATADGLMVTSWARDTMPNYAAAADDQWFEEMHVFPIVNNNRVDLGAIRDYLGY